MASGTVIYVRGGSPEGQERWCRDWCAAHRRDVVEVIREQSGTGSTWDRPGLIRLINLAAEGLVSTVVVVDPSRLARDIEILEAVRARCEVISVRLLLG